MAPQPAFQRRPKTIRFDYLLQAEADSVERLELLMPKEVPSLHTTDASVVFVSIGKPAFCWRSTGFDSLLLEHLLRVHANPRRDLPRDIQVTLGLFAIKAGDLVPFLPPSQQGKGVFPGWLEATATFSLRELIDDPALASHVLTSAVNTQALALKQASVSGTVLYVDVVNSKANTRRSFFLVDFWNVFADPKTWRLQPEFELMVRALSADFPPNEFEAFAAKDLGLLAAKILARRAKLRFMVSLIDSKAHEPKNESLLSFLRPLVRLSKPQSFESLLLRRAAALPTLLETAEANEGRRPSEDRSPWEVMVRQLLCGRAHSAERPRDPSRDRRKSTMEISPLANSASSSVRVMRLVLRPDDSRDALFEQNEKLIQTLFAQRAERLKERRDADALIKALESRVKFLTVTKGHK